MVCPRCGGRLVPDDCNKGYLKCIMCGRWPSEDFWGKLAEALVWGKKAIRPRDPGKTWKVVD